jgi:toxin secretion/phage lysis holin
MSGKTQFYALSTLSSAAGVLLGLPLAIKLLVLAIAVDIVTGLMSAFINATVNSAVSAQGMTRKGLMLIVTGTAEIVSRAIHISVTVPGGEPLSLGAAVAGFYAIHEAISILENLAKAGVPVPKFISERMMNIKKFYDQL